MTGGSLTKPAVNCGKPILSRNPSKNYEFKLLNYDILSKDPRRSLDAGAGELRNRWMFPGEYYAITQNRSAFYKGLRRNLKAPVVRSAKPIVYLTSLDEDFSFLSPMDLCVCTNTISYVHDHADVISRLAAIVGKGGTLIFDDDIKYLQQDLAPIRSRFKRIDVTYFGYEGCFIADETLEKTTVEALSYIEMRAPNTPEHHQRFYAIAHDKIDDAVTPGMMPKFIDDGGLLIPVGGA